jgi:outer membrane protein assembly factor BamD (BamD/ComL family)
VVLAGLAALTGAGCQSTGTFNPMNLWRISQDDTLSKPPTLAETGDDRSIMARWISPKKPPAGNVNSSSVVLGSDGWRPMKAEPNPEADKEFKAVETLYQQGKLEEAETGFQELAKKRKGTPWGEKSQYYLAETQYQRNRLVAAHDSYDLLIKDYPGTEYVAKVAKREYEIAQFWLAQCDPKLPDDKKLPWESRFNGRLPLLDLRGHALRALEHVRHNNPNGELADDAVLRIADEHFALRDYDSAALYYDQLITDHPKSPFLQRAQLAVIDTRMRAYLGPEYDGSGLEKARDMVHQTMHNFPDRPAGTEKLYHTLDLINDAEAERTYVIAEYYRRTGKVASAEFYYGKIPRVWPKSPWATKAKTQLASLAKMPRTQSLPSKIMSLPGSNDSFFSGQGGMGMGMGGMGMGGMGMGGMGPGGMN